MEILPTNSTVQLFNSAQQKASIAATTIAQSPIQKNEVGSTNFNPQDITKPILSLKEAEFETSAATKLLNAEKKTTGSLLNVIA